jgi:phosphoglycolate phosphatase
VKFAFFDLDGTLTDSAPGIVRCLQYAVGELGASPPDHDALVSYIGTGLDAIFRELLCTEDPARIERAIALYIERFQRLGIRENSLYPGVAEGLGTLHAVGLRLRIATAKTEAVAREVAEVFDIDGYFEAIHGLRGSGGSDKGAMLCSVLREQGIAGADCSMVGDRHHDIRAARAAGMSAIAVGWGYASPGELAAAAPDVTADSFAALVSFLLDR